MTHKFSTTSTTPLRTFAAISAALFSTLLLMACSGGPQAALPLAPSALPSSMLALEAADGSDAWGTLGNRGQDGPRAGADDADSDADDADSDSGDADSDDDDADSDGDDDADSDGPDAGADVGANDARQWEGTVTSRSGTCQAITFVVGTRTVVTNATTVFHGGTCLQVLNGTRVRVRGTLRPDGTVLASRVDITTADRGNDTDRNPHQGAGPLHGTVSSFRGDCPTVTFNLKGMTIVADAATYAGGTCATLRPNVQVVVTGAPAPGRRMFKAATITITRTH